KTPPSALEVVDPATMPLPNRPAPSAMVFVSDHPALPSSKPSAKRSAIVQSLIVHTAETVTVVGSAVPEITTSAAVKPSTGSENSTSNPIGESAVGSGWPTAWLIVTVGPGTIPPGSSDA